jgi:aminopeptidase N
MAAVHRLARALDCCWSKLAELLYRSAAREAISRVAAKPPASKDTYKVVTQAGH